MLNEDINYNKNYTYIYLFKYSVYVACLLNKLFVEINGFTAVLQTSQGNFHRSHLISTR